jgi:ribosome recycling factor
MSSIKTTNPPREGEMIMTEVPRMTAEERNEPKTLVNERARLAVTQVRALAADRLVELNRQLEASWAIEDFEIGEMWKELRQIADTDNTKSQPAAMSWGYTQTCAHPP